MNEPIGRFGSCRPLRLRRTALATAATASSWPTTRWCSRSSSTSSLARSVSSMRVTGMPVQALTTSAISSGPTSWRSSRRPAAGFVGGLACSAASSSCLAQLLALDVELVQLLIGGFVDRRAGGLLLLDRGVELVELELDLVELLAHLLHVAQAQLFGFPLLAQAGQLAVAARAISSSISAQPLLGVLFGLVGQLPGGQFELRQPALHLVDLGRARFPAPSPAGWWPRPSGRSPCRAGSGR